LHLIAVVQEHRDGLLRELRVVPMLPEQETKGLQAQTGDVVGDLRALAHQAQTVLTQAVLVMGIGQRGAARCSQR
jgi:hypothetical protein